MCLTAVLAFTPAHAETVMQAKARVDQLIGAAMCTTDGDCATLPLPDQACGGPSGWVAYSTRQTSMEALRQALTRWGAAGARQGGAAASTCEMRPDPGARCVIGADGSGRCRLSAAPMPGPIR